MTEKREMSPAEHWATSTSWAACGPTCDDKKARLEGIEWGKLWLLAELEKRYRGVCDKYELGIGREYEATIYRIIEEARELCGK